MSEALFVARDKNGDVYLVAGGEKPKIDNDGNFDLDSASSYYQLEVSIFWDVRPVQCREIEITYKD